MVDRIPLFPDDGTYPGYTATQPEVLTQDQYRAGQVNYFTQVLGPQTASLREETGVGVTKAPEVGREETREDDPSPKAPSAILAATRPTLGGDISASGEISFDIPDANPGGGSYSKFLSEKGMDDRIPLVNIYEGMAYDDIEVNLFENIGAAAKEGGKKVADPKKAVGSMFKNVKNAFNNNSFRGFGAGGAFADMVHSIQYRDLDLIRIARTAGAADTGFAMTLGDYGITRAPGGRTYTGNTRGMDIETITALEAISKGYDPTRGRYNPLDPRSNQTVVASGGIQVSNNPMDGFIRANGTVYDPRFIGAGASGAYARTDMIKKAATYYGVTPDQMSGALAVARSGTMNVRQALNNVLAPKLKAFQEKASQEMEAFKEEQRQRDFDQRMYGADSPRPETRAREDRERERVERTVADVKDRTEATKGSRETFAIGFADGGRVGLAMGGAPRMASGFVERPPDQVPEDQTVADDKKAQLPEGAFVINAAAAEFMGTDDVRKMLLDAHKEALRQGLVVDKQGNGAKLIDVAISRGEVVVAPHLAKIIGYDRLIKINNRGKPETRERIQENDQQPIGVAEGGFIPQPTSKPGLVERRRDEALADVELRADLEAFIREDNLARLGWKLYTSGQLKLQGVPFERDAPLGYTTRGQYFPQASEDTYTDANITPIDDPRLMVPKIAKKADPGFVADPNTPTAMYFAEPTYIPRSQRDPENPEFFETKRQKRLIEAGIGPKYTQAQVMLTLAHELRHAAIDHLVTKYGAPHRSLATEERLMDFADGKARKLAAKIDKSVSKYSPHYNEQVDERTANKEMYRSMFKMYDEMAGIVLKELKVPKRAVATKKGFLEKFMDNLFK